MQILQKPEGEWKNWKGLFLWFVFQRPCDIFLRLMSWIFKTDSTCLYPLAFSSLFLRSPYKRSCTNLQNRPVVSLWTNFAVFHRNLHSHLGRVKHSLEAGDDFPQTPEVRGSEMFSLPPERQDDSNRNKKKKGKINWVWCILNTTIAIPWLLSSNY